jgi:hypothetical protein
LQQSLENQSIDRIGVAYQLQCSPGMLHSRSDFVGERAHPRGLAHHQCRSPRVERVYELRLPQKSAAWQVRTGGVHLRARPQQLRIGAHQWVIDDRQDRFQQLVRPRWIAR